MLTGRRLFQGKTTSEILAAVIRDEPDLTKVPGRVRPLLKRCLEKDPKRRLRDIGDAMGIVENTPEGPAVGRRWLPWGVAAVSLFALGALSFARFGETQPQARVMIANVDPPESTSFNPVGSNPPTLSPDGRQIAFRARVADGKAQLWVRPIDSASAKTCVGRRMRQLIPSTSGPPTAVRSHSSPTGNLSVLMLRTDVF
jgi:serine/threonine-protein kinase